MSTDSIRWGRTIRRLRINRLGMSQREFAEHLSGKVDGSLTQSAVAHWERGDASPSPRHRLAVAEAFEVPAEVLFAERELG